LVEAQPDASLSELREQLYQKTQVWVGVATVDRMVRLKLNFTFKKKPAPQQKRNGGSPTCAI
jgi:transposase